MMRHRIGPRQASADNTFSDMKYDARDSRQIIEALRVARGFTSARALAIAADIPQPTLSRYLAGTSETMELQNWIALANTLEVTVSQLLGEIPLDLDPKIVQVTRIMDRLEEWQREVMVMTANAMAAALPSTTPDEPGAPRKAKRPPPK